jgi:hypothetical protein
MQSQINAVISSKGGLYSKYKCNQVSWDDISRNNAGSSSVSCIGSNITDTRLYSKDNTLLYTLRPDNWKEKIGNVSSDDISLIHNNTPITLTEYLKEFKDTASYAIKNGENMYSPTADKNVSVRFQTTFLPVENCQNGNIELSPEVYNYGSKNIQLLCTSQGTSVQRGISGKQKLFHHEKDSNGKIHRYWFEAERTNHDVGGSQIESEEEIKDALNRGKSIATCIGTKAMGTRFNVLMTIQVPTEQNKRDTTLFSNYTICSATSATAKTRSGGRNLSQRKTEPRVSAGRLSRGSEYDTWECIDESLKREHSQHITVTIVLYNTVAGGVPNETDITTAIDDMENLYESCHWNGDLTEKPAAFMKSNNNNNGNTVQFIPLSVPSFTPTKQQFHESLKTFPVSN